ncbi:MAG: HSP90 family protein, partial [Agromyces sp.]
VLEEVGCEPSVRRFAPSDLASLYLADAEVLRSITRGAARDTTGPLWSGVLGRIDEHLPSHGSGGAARAKLCLNWDNPLVRTLAADVDDAVFDRTIRLLYVQALLAGHRPLRASERAMLTGALTDLVALSLAR